MRYVSHDRHRVGSGRVSGLLVEECIVTSTDDECLSAISVSDDDIYVQC